MLVIISIGSNLGNRQEYLQYAVDRISSLPNSLITKVSSIYETQPQVLLDQPTFFNAVLELETLIQPSILLSLLKEIELGANRERTIPNGPRTLDIDIISCDEVNLNDPELSLPHPRAHLRQFVLLPWLEIDQSATLGSHGFVSKISAQLGDQGVIRIPELRLI